MEQNFLYMFEFVVDEVMVVKPNKCAPEEYPLCCEVSFRNSVFVSICDHEFGQCVDLCKPKCGKSCLFSLESPITDDDKLHIHIYKKKTELCKFLIGCTDLPIRNVFDRVIDSFNIENPNWQEISIRHAESLPNPKEKKAAVVDNNCDSSEEERREQLCPTSELTKQLLPIFNLKGCQTGNMALLIRLVAIGPTIVSTFPFARLCSAGCDKKPPNCDENPFGPISKCCTVNDSCRCSAGMDEMCDSDGNKPTSSKKRTDNGCLPLRDPCKKEVKKLVVQRYFACNADKGCPYDDIEDECQRAAKCKEQKKKLSCCSTPSQAPRETNSCSCDECAEECEAAESSCPTCPSCPPFPSDPFKCEQCSVNSCDDRVADPYSPCGQCLQPCFQTPRKHDPGPEAYDEFEACLNGSGMTIRVLKDTHQVENICDGTEDFNDDNSECNKYNGKENMQRSDCSFANVQRTNFVRNHIKRRTGGHIINHPNLPKIRANIKYSGNDSCYPDNYNVPYSKVQNYCENQLNKIDNYRSHRAKKFNLTDNDSICQPKHRKNEKNCCVQVDRQDIRNFMKGLESDTRKKGIEVCYRTCEDTESDIFLVKLGSKHKSDYKKNNIEIELKTPKLPLTLPKKHVTTETQINEAELDAALAESCKSKKGKKGKRGRKGRK